MHPNLTLINISLLLLFNEVVNIVNVSYCLYVKGKIAIFYLSWFEFTVQQALITIETSVHKENFKWSIGI